MPLATDRPLTETEAALLDEVVARVEAPEPTRLCDAHGEWPKVIRELQQQTRAWRAGAASESVSPTPQGLPAPPSAIEVEQVFARYGLALYHAQVTERNLALLLVTAYASDPTEWTAADFDRELESLTSRPMGHTVRRFIDLGVSPTFLDRLKIVLEDRNWLAHRYFWERAAVFNTSIGCQDMLAELDECSAAFSGLNDEVHALTIAWLRGRGLDEATITTEIERALRTAREI